MNDDTITARQKATLEMTKLREVGRAFFAEHPVGTVIAAIQMLKWVEAHGGESRLKTDLLAGTVFRQLSSIRRHLNDAGVSCDAAEASRFYVEFTDRKHTGFIVRTLRSPAQPPSEANPTTGEKRRRGRQPRPAPLLDLLESMPPPGAQHEENVDACCAQSSTEMKRKRGRPKGSKNRPKVALTFAEAIAMVKAAGYRVSKPRKSKIFKRGKDRVGPTFVCEFADGTTTRMSTFTSLERLDWERGKRLSQAAYQSRWRTQNAPPAIIAAHFEQDGKILARYEQRDLPPPNSQPHAERTDTPTTYWLSFTNGTEFGGVAIVDVGADEIGKAGAFFAAIRKSLQLRINPGPDYSADGREIPSDTIPEEFKYRLLSRTEADSLKV
jgi:hypothetical protein